MDNPSNVESDSSSSEDSYGDFEDSWTDSEKKDFVENWIDGIKSYVNDQIVEISLDVRNEIKAIKRQMLLKYYMEKLSIPKRTDKDFPVEKQIHHANNCEVSDHSNAVLSESYACPAAHEASTSSPPSGCKTLSDIIYYVIKYCRRPDNFWKMDTERLWARFDTFMIQNSERTKEFPSFCKRALESLDNVNLVKPMIEYIHRDLYAIDHHEPENLVQIYHRYNSLIRQIMDFYKTFGVHLRYLFTFIEVCGELEADTLQHLNEFLNSDLDFYRNPETIS